jgi:lipoprotein-anchoring transpeptidase ErfK/SrfK
VKDQHSNVDDRARQLLAVALLGYASSPAFVPRLAAPPWNPPHHRLRPFLLSVLPVFGLALLGWVAGNFYLSHYQLGSTKLATRMSDSALQQHLAQAQQTYRLAIIGPHSSKQTYSLQQMGVQTDPVATIANLKREQHSWRHRLQWWQPIPVQFVTKADTTSFNTFIAHRATIITEPAHDASLSIVSGNVQLSDGAAGKQYGLVHPTSAILGAASQLQTAPLKLHAVAQRPEITALSLAASKAKIEQVLQQHVSFTIDSQTVTPKPSDIANWLTLRPDTKAKTVAVNVSAANVQTYIAKLASDHTRPARSQITLGSNGVISGQSGVAVINKDAASNQVIDHLLEAKGLQVDIPVRHTGFKTISATAAPKWIEVDLTNKRMYAYQQTEVVRTFLVSAGAPATPTVTGTFAIYSKYAKQNMTGANADGSRYNQPNVPWVNYFYRDYAIHGNYWRPQSYFGNVNSSHGCVGITPSDATWMYTWASVGTPVVVHT